MSIESRLAVGNAHVRQWVCKKKEIERSSFYSIRKLSDVSLALDSTGIWVSTAYCHFLTQAVNRFIKAECFIFVWWKIGWWSQISLIANMADQVTLVQQVAVESWVVETDFVHVVPAAEWNHYFNCQIQGDAKAWEWSLEISVLGKESVPETRSRQFYSFLTLRMSS